MAIQTLARPLDDAAPCADTFDAVDLPDQWETNAGAVMFLAAGILRRSSDELRDDIATAISDSPRGAIGWLETVERLDAGADVCKTASDRLTAVLRQIEAARPDTPP